MSKSTLPAQLQQPTVLTSGGVLVIVAAVFAVIFLRRR